MPCYRNLDPMSPSDSRTLERLPELRTHLSKEIPPRTLNDTLLLATWNLNGFEPDPISGRLSESYYYIAEIVDRFDIMVLQQVHRDLKALNRLCAILGNQWSYLVTDMATGKSGIPERMAFLYDSRKVRFEGLAGEMIVSEGGEQERTCPPTAEIARFPFLCGFSSGWTRFLLATLHVCYDRHREGRPDRLDELRRLIRTLKARAQDPDAWARNLILLGDFNLYRPEDKVSEALRKMGFIIPGAIQNMCSLHGFEGKLYDQIAFLVRRGHLGFTGNAGVFDYYQSVFRDEDQSALIREMGDSYYQTAEGRPREERERRRYFRDIWRTRQMSDHLVLWAELMIDNSDLYLRKKRDQVARH